MPRYSKRYGEQNGEVMQFKPWLVQQISSGKFKDLEWIDAEQQRIFKLPWTKKNYPHWEEHHKLFQAWANYRSDIRGLTRVPNLSFSLMKSNFRTILRKCHDIEELKNFHQLGLQTGNYKVYKVLTEEESSLKRAKLLLEKAPGCIEDLNNSNDIIEITTRGDNDLPLPVDPNITPSWIAQSTTLGIAVLEAKRDIQKRVRSNLIETSNPKCRKIGDESSDSHSASKPKVKRTQSTQTFKDSFGVKEIVFLPNVDSSAHRVETESITSEIIVDDNYCINEEVVEKAEGFQILLEAAEITSEQSEMAIHESEEEVLHSEIVPSLEEVLNAFNVERNELSMFEVTIKYSQEEIFTDVWTDMNTGYRIYSGVDETLIPEKDDFYISAKLPKSSKLIGPIFEAFMADMNGRIIVKLDSNHNLSVKRLCSSSVNVTTYLSENGMLQSFPLENDKELVVFDYSQFLFQFLGSLKEKQILTTSKLIVSLLVEGSGKSRNNKNRVVLEFVSKAAKSLINLSSSDVVGL